jgi:hypothetical protein
VGDDTSSLEAPNSSPEEGAAGAIWTGGATKTSCAGATGGTIGAIEGGGGGGSLRDGSGGGGPFDFGGGGGAFDGAAGTDFHPELLAAAGDPLLEAVSDGLRN